MKKRIISSIFLVFMFALSSVLIAGGSAVLYQVSTLGAVQEGYYDGVTRLKELKTKGDFGIGTYNALDGEMILLDGIFFQVKSDGRVYKPEDDATTPFAAVTTFEADRTSAIDKPCVYAELTRLIEASLPSMNIPCAIRIEGEFSYVKTRSVPAQKKPYPRLAEVVKNQPVFEMKNIKGTISGFWLPQFYSGINLPGFHLHFISEDKTSGGHLLDCSVVSGRYSVEYIYNTLLTLPEKSDFYKLELGKTDKKELEKIEK